MAKDVVSGSRATALLNTHGGPALLLWAPLNTAFPTKIDDVVNIAGGVTQWQPKTGWTSMGMTKGGINLSRGATELKREADQTWGTYDTRPTAWEAMVSTTLLETSPVAFQIAWVGSGIVSVAKIQTVLGVAAAAGVSSVTVAAAGAIASGDYISIGNGPTQEYAQVTTVASNVLTLSAVTQYAHLSGELALKFGTNTVSFGTSRSVPPRLLAAIAPLSFDDPTAGGVVNGIRMWAFRRVKLEGAQRQVALSNAADWDLPVSFLVLPDVSITDPEFDTLQMFEMAY